MAALRLAMAPFIPHVLEHECDKTGATRVNCSNCGAPIPPKSNICRFCGTVNDTDLRGIREHIQAGPQGDRPCPRCGTLLHTIDIAAEGGFEIDRCAKCLGIFFDPGELGSLVDVSVSQVHRIDHDKMTALIEEEGGVEAEVKYVKRPVCRELMNRRSYGARSGVVADTCKTHGIWLDGGELGRILKWVKAGGLLHDARRKDEDKRTEQRNSRVKGVEYQREFDGGKLADDYSYPYAEGILRALLRFFR